MTHTSAPSWTAMCTDETRNIENTLRNAGFQQVDAYRYNSASIRVRVIDPGFEGLPLDERDAKVEQYLKQLPERTQADIINLLTFAPSEFEQPPFKFRGYLLNIEFEDPSPSLL